MRFQKTTVSLLFYERKFHFFGRNAQINPWRHLGHFQILGAIKNELRNYLLKPGGARLRIGSNDDVIVSEIETIPGGGIEMMAVHLTRFLRPLSNFHWMFLFR